MDVNIITKKDKIIEALKNGTDVEDICTELEVSTSYVYRIKREMDESEGDETEDIETEEDSISDLAIDSSGGDSLNVEGNNDDVEEKSSKRKTDKDNRLGGVTKKKKVQKKVQKKSIKEDNEQSERTGGALKWMKKQWKKTLLISTSLILLAVMTLLSFQKKPEATKVMESVNPSRFPILQH